MDEDFWAGLKKKETGRMINSTKISSIRDV
jgi:hypothetical protein